MLRLVHCKHIYQGRTKICLTKYVHWKSTPPPSYSSQKEYLLQNILFSVLVSLWGPFIIIIYIFVHFRQFHTLFSVMCNACTLLILKFFYSTLLLLNHLPSIPLSCVMCFVVTLLRPRSLGSTVPLCASTCHGWLQSWWLPEFLIL